MRLCIICGKDSKDISREPSSVTLHGYDYCDAHYRVFGKHLLEIHDKHALDLERVKMGAMIFEGDHP